MFLTKLLLCSELSQVSNRNGQSQPMNSGGPYSPAVSATGVSEAGVSLQAMIKNHLVTYCQSNLLSSNKNNVNSSQSLNGDEV
jgi:hypothetical protein